MEMLKQLKEEMNRHESESQHAGYLAEDWHLVGGLSEDYVHHRERIEAYRAPSESGWTGVGGLPEPSEATSLMSPWDGAKLLQGDDCL